MKLQQKKWNAKAHAEKLPTQSRIQPRLRCRASCRKWSARKFSACYESREETNHWRRASWALSAKRCTRKRDAWAWTWDRHHREEFAQRAAGRESEPDQALAVSERVASGVCRLACYELSRGRAEPPHRGSLFSS